MLEGFNFYYVLEVLVVLVILFILSQIFKLFDVKGAIGAVIIGSGDLNIPLPTNTPSTPSFIISAPSAGVATPPAAKMTKGGVIMDVTNAEQARIAETAGAVAVMALAILIGSGDLNIPLPTNTPSTPSF